MVKPIKQRYTMTRTEELQRMRMLLIEAIQLGAAIDLPSSWEAGLVLSDGWVRKQLAKEERAKRAAEFNAKLQTPAYAGARPCRLMLV